jgi:hypothetical protein
MALPPIRPQQVKQRRSVGPKAIKLVAEGFSEHNNKD